VGTSDWCRACGNDAPGPERVCNTCGSSLEGPSKADSLVGLAFEVPGKLRVTKRLAICLAVDGESAKLHISPKEKDTVTVPTGSLASPLETVPSTLSPASRLLYASRQPDCAIKANWDADTLLSAAGAAAATSLGAMRRVADEAIELGWPDIVDWTTLTNSEKTWRRSHQSASIGDTEDLLLQLAALPSSGYHDRVDLLMPHLSTVIDQPAFRQLVDSWHQGGIPGADVLHELVHSEWSDAMSVGEGVLRARRGRHPVRPESAELADRWAAIHASFTAGGPVRPLGTDCSAWAAAAVVGAARAGANVDGEVGQLGPLAMSIFDDLIDGGWLTAAADIESNASQTQYLLARLRPHELDDAGCAGVGHHTELARRFCRRRDESSLQALPASPGVAHYQALLDVVSGRKPDATRLRPECLELLELANRSLAALKDKATSTLPAPIINDPTLWPMFSEHARSGRLSPDGDERANAPAFAQWCDLQRLVGLLWDERWVDAVALGEKLTAGLDTERQEDEALSLTAYAMSRLGRGDEAMGLLERAMAGSYTEALLVNLSLVASFAKPDVAAAQFARIVNEAPNRELQIAALRRAVEVWERTPDMPTFPPDLVGPMKVVLSGDCSVDDFARFGSLAAAVAPEVVLAVSDPGGERAPLHRLYRARARLAKEDNFGLKELASEFIAVYRQVGRPTWFNEEWERLMSFLRDSVFVAFGEAGGSALMIDTVAVDAPELLSQHERFVLVPQAGAHLAAVFATTDDTLSRDAMVKFFYRPIEEFLAERSNFDPTTVDFVAENFHLTLFIAAMHYLETMRDSLANPYNSLVERLRYDSQNRYAIVNQMRAVLDDGSRHQEEIDRALDRLRRLAVDTEKARDRLGALTEELNEWRTETVRLRANL
jgi:hypothetical protein